MTDITAKSSALDNWSSSDETIALAHLSELQNQLTDLRAILPNIIQPLTFPHNSPESVLADFKHSAFRAVHLLKRFRTQWEATETTRLLQEVQAKKDAEVKGIRTSRLVLGRRDDPRRHSAQDLMERNKTASPDNKDDSYKSEEGKQSVAAILKEFEKQNPDISVKQNDQNAFIDIYVPTKSGQFRFTVTERADPIRAYQITCQGSTKLCQAVTNALKERIRQNDLQYTLENIAAYRTLFSEKCASCSQLLDSDAMLPVMKVIRTSSSGSEVEKSSWLAYHKPCLK